MDPLESDLINASIRISLSCDYSRGVDRPIIDEVARRTVECQCTPLYHTTVVFDEAVGDVNADTIAAVIENIYSLNFKNAAYVQRRQYLQMINCSVIDYEFMGTQNGTRSLNSSNVDQLDTIPKSLLLFDKTLSRIKYGREFI